MPKVSTYNITGAQTGEIELNDSVFGVEVNEAVMRQAVLRQLANQRLGTHSTKTRGLVRGGGRKPWKQKGTGRARVGSNRSPLWVGGGTIWGPHPRSYEQSILTNCSSSTKSISQLRKRKKLLRSSITSNSPVKKFFSSPTTMKL